MGTLEKLDVPEYLCGENQWETESNINLFNAASEGDINKLKEAISNGANPNFISKNGEQLSSLHAAARSLSSSSENGAALCARELIGHGARASCRSVANKNEAVHEASFVGNEGVVEVLVESSPKCISSENAFGNTALHAATRSGSPDVVKLLVEKGAQVNKQNHVSREFLVVRVLSMKHLTYTYRFPYNSEEVQPCISPVSWPSLKAAVMILPPLTHT